MDLKDIGKRIREKRLEKAWNQKDLAQKAHLTETYIGMIERGEKVPKLETFIKLANILEASAEELLGDVIQKPKMKIVGYIEKI